MLQYASYFLFEIQSNMLFPQKARTGWTVQGNMKLKLSAAQSNSTSNSTTNSTVIATTNCTSNCTTSNNSTNSTISVDDTPFTIVGGYYSCAAVDTDENEWVLGLKSVYPIPIYSVTIYKYVFFICTIKNEF